MTPEEELDRLYALGATSPAAPVNTMVTPEVRGAGGGLGQPRLLFANPNFLAGELLSNREGQRYVKNIGPKPEILSPEDALAKAQKHYEFRSPSGQKEDWLTSLSRAFRGFGAASHGFGGDGSHALNFMSGEDARNKEIAEADLARMVGEQDLADSLLQESIKKEAAWREGFHKATSPGHGVARLDYAPSESQQFISQDSPEWLEVAFPTLRSITDRLKEHATAEMHGEWIGVTNYLDLLMAQGILSEKELNKWLDFGLKLQSLSPEELQNAKNMQEIINKLSKERQNSTND